MPSSFSAPVVAPLTLTSTTAPQLTVAYDGTDKATISVGSTGLGTINFAGSNPQESVIKLNGNPIIRFEAQGNGGTVFADIGGGDGTQAAFSTTTGGNFSSTIPRFDVTGNPYGGAAGLSDGGASNSLGLVINSLEVAHFTSTLATFTMAVIALVTVVGSLPAASGTFLGARAFVTDASTTVILGLGLTVVGGGANKVPVYCDGTAWKIG